MHFKARLIIVIIVTLILLGDYLSDLKLVYSVFN